MSEESDEILLTALRDVGVKCPAQTIKEIEPEVLVAAAGVCLKAMTGTDFPTEMPGEMSGRFAVCTQLADAIKGQGYNSEIGFQQFMYPEEKSVKKLLQWLVNSLPQGDEAVLMSKTRSWPSSPAVSTRVSFANTRLQLTGPSWARIAPWQAGCQLVGHVRGRSFLSASLNNSRELAADARVPFLFFFFFFPVSAESVRGGVVGRVEEIRRGDDDGGSDGGSIAWLGGRGRAACTSCGKRRLGTEKRLQAAVIALIAAVRRPPS
jgi:hypothetical protein